MTLHGAASDRESLHDVTLHGGPAPLLVGLVVLGLGLLAGEIVHQASASLT